MSIPLGYFLIAWAALLGIYGILVFLTLIQTLRHGISTPFTYVSTFLFLTVIAAVLGGCGLVFIRTDWKAPVDLVPTSLITSFGSTPEKVLEDIPL